MRSILSTAVELLGLALLVLAAYLFDPRTSLIAGGLVLLLIGFAVDGTPVKKSGPDR